jgi:hypothetical protein
MSLQKLVYVAELLRMQTHTETVQHGKSGSSRMLQVVIKVTEAMCQRRWTAWSVAYTIRPLATRACVGWMVTVAELSDAWSLFSIIFAIKLVDSSASCMVVKFMAYNLCSGPQYLLEEQVTSDISRMRHSARHTVNTLATNNFSHRRVSQ